MAHASPLRLTPVVDVEPTSLECQACRVGTLQRMTVSLLHPGGVFARRYLICGACGRTALDLPPEESRPSGGGA